MEIVGCSFVSVETFVEFSLTRNVLTEPLPRYGLFRVCSFQEELTLGEPSASNGLPHWLHYSGFQAVLTERLPSSSHIRHNIVLSHDSESFTTEISAFERNIYVLTTSSEESSS
jgi:hypothetical protein